MERCFRVFWVVLFFGILVFPSVSWAGSEKAWTFVITTSSAETAWNALRVARFALKEGHEVAVFFLGEGVATAQEDKEPFNVKDSLKQFIDDGGKVYACKACLRLHELKPSETCPVGTLKILYQLIENANKLLVF